MEREIEVLGSDAGGRDVNTSVVVCTYNRCQSLFSVLEGIAAQHMPDSVSWEVVVVDNNSTDKTREAVEEASRKWPGRFRYVFEHRQGQAAS